MATPPDFSVGQVLTAAHMNAVGLWLVKTQTIGTSVSSVTVSNAFNADFENYKILVSGGAGSGNLELRLQLGSTTTGYYTGINGVTWSTGAAALGARNNTVGYMDWVGFATTNGIDVNFDLSGPYLAKETIGSGRFVTNSASYFSASRLANTTSYTAFTLSTASGTLTGGTIRVYGYRN